MPTGVVRTYDLTVGIPLNIEDRISLITPTDVPLLGTVTLDGNSTLSSETCFEKKVEWLDETLLHPRSTLGQTMATSDAYILVATGQQLRFMTSDVLRVGTEYVRVTGYGTTTDSLLVTRAYAGTQAQVANASDVIGVGSAGVEGNDPELARSQDRSNRFNYTEIFGPYAVRVSGTENTIRKYGIQSNEFDHQVQLRTKEIAIAMEQAILYGTRVEDTTNGWRSHGGLTYYITTNVDSTTTVITESALLAQLQAAFDAGGNVDRLVMGSKQKRLVSAFTAPNNPQVTITRQDIQRGVIVDQYMSDFGMQAIVLDRWCKTADLFGFNRNDVTRAVLRPMQFQMLAKTGDATKGQVLAESTLKVHTEPHQFRFNALT